MKSDKILENVIHLYIETQEKITEIEGDTATAVLNFKFYENQRHGLSHLIQGLNESNEEKKCKQFSEALHHIENLALDGFEHIAGTSLKRTRDAIENAGLGKSEKAKKIFEKALRHYNQGRTTRAHNTTKSENHFKQTIKLSEKAYLEIIPLSQYEKITLWLVFFGAILTIIGLYLNYIVFVNTY